jgi:membrane protein insertase Oxa1/YidC/SpoIIIJ
MIFQFIVFINIYSIIRNLIGQGVTSFNDLAYSFVPKFAEGYTINTDFFGIVDLKQTANGVNEFPQILPYIILILLVGLTQWGSMKVMMALRSDDKEEEKKPKKKGEPEDFGEIFQQSTRQAMLLMPIVFMFLSFNLPSGLSIYLITTSTFVILQQLFMHKIRRQPAEGGQGVRKL